MELDSITLDLLLPRIPIKHVRKELGLDSSNGLKRLELRGSSSSSFELFVVSFMQEDIYIGHTALVLTLGLQVFS